MPTAPKRGGAYDNCPNLAVAHSQYCEEHKRLYDRSYDKFQRRAGYNKRYGSRWKKVRKLYAESHPFCEKCLERGVPVPVEEVHHIVPTARGGDDSFENLMSLCRSCHNKIHRELGDR